MVDVSLGLLDGPVFEILDPRFAACVVPDARVERIWTGSRWTEGPAWLAGRGLLIWSDIPADQMLSWEETTGEVAVFRRAGRMPKVDHRTEARAEDGTGL